MTHRDSGFTMVELVIAIMIGSILTGIALTSFGSVRSGFAVRGAQNTFASVVARTRAQAIEFGTNISLLIDTEGDSLTVLNGTTVLETVHMGGEANVDIVGDSTSYTLCMNSRGYADTDCNSFSATITVTFVQSFDSASVQVMPLGQLVY